MQTDTSSTTLISPQRMLIQSASTRRATARWWRRWIWDWRSSQESTWSTSTMRRSARTLHRVQIRRCGRPVPTRTAVHASRRSRHQTRANACRPHVYRQPLRTYGVQEVLRLAQKLLHRARQRRAHLRLRHDCPQRWLPSSRTSVCLLQCHRRIQKVRRGLQMEDQWLRHAPKARPATRRLARDLANMRRSCEVAKMVRIATVATSAGGAAVCFRAG
mmetsp:Transcript_94211/g.236394  ORF Transcript_94211/g.236394 Transcript_94211/m.236394 type:complete len:217 (+) Transcript_94211:242-892(+)